MSVSKGNKKVAVGLSGGVDSSVALLLLRDLGYEPTGVYMQCWDIKDEGCAADEDKSYAVQTAAKLGAKFQALDFREEYKSKVIDYFYDEYSKGRTPNPDVMCNKEIKFGIFFDWAMKNGFDYIATGHYARVQRSEKESGFKLLMGIDEKKDQSYFLYRLGQEQLSKTLFPIGEYTKPQVREMAKAAGLPSYKRAESMGICFIGEVDIRDFLEQRIEHKIGNVLDTGGSIVGSHDGVWFFTVGQRHGFKLDKYFGVPMYVVDKKPETNDLIIGTYEEVLSDGFEVSDVSWVLESKARGAQGLRDRVECRVRIRHLGRFINCVIKKNPERLDYFSVKLAEKVFGVASGQSAVFYLNDEVLGGGIIV